MKNVSKLLVLVVSFVLLGTLSYGQCRTFAKTECKPSLEPYVHDGIFNATELSEGESAELYKTFYSNQNYRIAICGDKQLPKTTKREPFTPSERRPISRDESPPKP